MIDIKLTHETFKDGMVMTKMFTDNELISITFEKNGVLHNDIGPARITINPHSKEIEQEYFLNGVYYYDPLQWMCEVGNLEEE